jgi:sporulation protein YlmC with PRC-barrel domain
LDISIQIEQFNSKLINANLPRSLQGGFMQSNVKSLTKDKLIGMKVIDFEGKIVGTVKDVGFTIGKAGISLSVEDKNGQILDISWESIQGAADFIVLKSTGQAQPVYAQATNPTPQAQTATTSQATCQICGGPLTWIPQYQRWYCYKDQKYA